jgi:major outer membrane protein
MESEMKKLVVTLLTILTCGAMQALPVENPGAASLFTNGMFCNRDVCDPCFNWCDAWSIRIGFYGNYVYNRHLEAKTNGHDIAKTTLFTNAGYLAFNICDRIDLFGTLGATTIAYTDTFVGPPSEFTPGVAVPNTVFVDTGLNEAFSWSVGGRVTLWESNCFMLGIEGEYFRTAPKYDYYNGDFQVGLVGLDDFFSNIYSEWQVGLGAAYTIFGRNPNFACIPYIAIKWSDCDLAHSYEYVVDLIDREPLQILLPGMQAAKHWGYAVGATCVMSNCIGVTVEGRFGDEKALYVNGQFRF